MSLHNNQTFIQCFYFEIYFPMLLITEFGSQKVLVANCFSAVLTAGLCGLGVVIDIRTASISVRKQVSPVRGFDGVHASVSRTGKW